MGIYFSPLFPGVLLGITCIFVPDTFFLLRMYLCEIKCQKNACYALFFKISTRLTMKEELKENSGGLSTGKEEGPKSIIVGALHLCRHRWKLSI